MLRNYLPSTDVHGCIPTHILTLANDTNTPNSTPCNKILLGKLTVPQLVKKFPRILRNPKDPHRFHINPPTVHILRQITPIHAPVNRFLGSYKPIHLHLRLPSGLLPSDSLTKTLYVILLSPIRATCPTHPILLDLINRITFAEQYRS